MISTRSLRFLYSPLQSVMRRKISLVIAPRASSGLFPRWQMLSTNSQSTKQEPIPIDQKTPGTITKRLRVLDMDVVKRISEELRSVDSNSDGRIDTSELKNLLRKHKQTFSDDEILQIGEMFYAGQSGGSVPIPQFIEALDTMVGDAGQDTNPLELGTCGNEYLFFNSHSDQTREDLKAIRITHTTPQSIRDRLALQCVKGVRFVFDTATGWNTKGAPITPDMVLNRTIFLETIAAVPGMVAAVIRHFRSLRTMQRDGGMLQMFLDEANNERMHLLTFVRMKNPGTLFRAAVIGGQFGFGALFGLSYIVAPKFCHRFVGYIEEEAVMTYTKIIDVIEDAPEDSDMGEWKTEIAPRIARSYWKLGQEGTVLDVMYAVRADEAEHRDVNHMCSELKDGDPNPVCNTSQQLNTMMVKYMKDMMERDVNVPLETQATDGTTTTTNK